MAAMLSRSGVRVFASAAKDNKPKQPRVVPKASLNDTPKMFKETGAEAPHPTASLNFTSTPFDNYKFAPIREATVSVVLVVVLIGFLLLLTAICGLMGLWRLGLVGVVEGVHTWTLKEMTTEPDTHTHRGMLCCVVACPFV